MSGQGLDFGGRVVASGSLGGSGGPEFTHPFKVLISGNVDDGFLRGVAYDSLLFKGRDSTRFPTRQTITGLLTSSTPASDDGGWAETTNGDYIWLDIGLAVNGETGEITIDNAQIHSHDVDTDWNGGEFEHDGGTGEDPDKVYSVQTVRIKIAEISIVDGVVTVRQFLTTNRVMEETVCQARDEGGNDPQWIPAIYPFPY